MKTTTKMAVKIVIFFLFILCSIGLKIGIEALITREWILGSLCAVPCLLFLIIFGLGGFFIVHQEERAVIELFGSFYAIKGPGLRWKFPFAMTIRQIVPIWEQSLMLFGTPIKIDFKDGSATPKKVVAFVEIKSPDRSYKLAEEGRESNGVYRSVYYVDKWQEKAIDLLENAARSYLATLTLDEALPETRGGYDLLTVNRIPKSEKGKIKRALERWGLNLKRITVTDFDLEPELVQARNEVQRRERRVEVAEFERKVRANETVGALIEMIAQSTGKTFVDIQAEINNNPEAKGKIALFAQELITRQMSIDGKSLSDIRVKSDNGILDSMLSLIAALKTIPSTTASSSN